MDCETCLKELASLGPDEPEGDVKAHLDACPRCRAALGQMRSIAATASARIPVYTPSHGLAIARRALSEAHTRHRGLWIAPLVSASATAAGLILWFGLAPPPQPTTQRPPETESWEATEELELPDELRSISEIFLGDTRREEMP